MSDYELKDIYVGGRYQKKDDENPVLGIIGLVMIVFLCIAMAKGCEKESYSCDSSTTQKPVISVSVPRITPGWQD